MAKILILAKSGFGKTTSLGEIPEIGLTGLNPKETYLISCVNKPLPFRNSKAYVITTPDKLKDGNRVITNNAKEIAEIINNLSQSPYKNIVLDDANYPSQDYYMANALKGGWDVPKTIGYHMGLIFNAINSIPETKNFIMLAHYEEYKDKNGDSISYKYKSTGNMIDGYIVPEGKFEIVLYGKASFDVKERKSIREFVTNDDGTYPAKSPFGMFNNLYIPNDLGYVINKIEEYYN